MMKKLSIKERALLVGQGLSPASATPPGSSPAASQAAPAPVAGGPLLPMRERPATGPGSMVRFLEGESKVFKENEQLKKELQSWEGAMPTRLIDSALVVESSWANRHPDSFKTVDFEQLKAEILNAGGNTQPIKVRPIPGSEPQRYEVVFGHRRHRACLELGLPVLAMVESVDDRTLFEEMERENRHRSDIRPYEQGVTYQRALRHGLYPTVRALADALGLDSTNVSRAVRIAEWPEAVLDAFPSRLDIQYRWVAPLHDALLSHRDQVIERAEQLAAQRKAGKALAAAAVFAALTSVKPAATPKVVERTLMGKHGSAKIVEDGGRLRAEFSKGALSADRIAKLDEFIGRLLEE